MTGIGERLFECPEDLYKCESGKIEVEGAFLEW